MARDSTDIAKISFFLAKAGTTFDSIIDPESALGGRQQLRTHDFEVDGVKCRFTYFETPTTKTNPPWLDFVNEQMPDDATISFRSATRSANGILLIGLHEKVLSATFGRSASSCLDRRTLELDFGIKTAMNMCGNEEIRQTKSQSTAITTTHIDRQVSKPSDSFVFGMSEAEDLSYISAHMKGTKTVTLQGRESLTYKVIGKDKLDWSRLIAQARQFVLSYESKDYVDLFPNYRNLKPADDEAWAKLDAGLIQALKVGDFSKLTLSIPEFFPDDEFSFSYSNNAARDDEIYAYLDVSQLATNFDLNEVTIEKLEAKWIYAYSHAEDRVLSYSSADRSRVYAVRC